MNKELKKYIRKDALPTRYCPGCGHGILMNIFVHACVGTILEPQKLVCVSGQGCAGWMPSEYLSFDTVHAPKGMAIAVAEGIKRGNPSLKVVVMCGDSDLAGKNLSTLLNAARKGTKLLVICANNKISALLNGAVSATSAIGAANTTYPEGASDIPLDFCKTVAGAGAKFVARYPIIHYRQLSAAFKTAFVIGGFSFIEALTICPEKYGKQNMLSTPVEMLNALRLGCVPGDFLQMNSQRGFSDPIFIGEYQKR